MKTTLRKAVTDTLQLSEFSPNPHVNSVMSRLVTSVTDSTYLDTLLLSRKTITEVRRISAKAESEMEAYWAERIISSHDPQQALEAFPYTDNYVELTRRELHLIEDSGFKLHKNQRALVIGSGPLPLSALEISKQKGLIVDHVDSSVEALELCRKVTSAIGEASKYYCARGDEVKLADKYDLILIAALAGESTQDKQAIIDNVLPSLSQNGRIIVRSAKGSRKLLYPIFSPRKIKNAQLLKVYHPDDYIINSVFIYTKVS